MKRPARFTTLAKYSKMKGVSKLVTGAKKAKDDTNSCFSEILEATLDDCFLMDDPCPDSAKKSIRSMSVCDESDQEQGDDAAPKAAKRRTKVTGGEAEVAARKKELKLLSKEAVQELASSKELATGKKDDMIEAVLMHEAKGRDDLRARELQAKQVLATKKQELEVQNSSALRTLCSKKSLKLSGSKQEQVKRILAKWKEEGGVDEALVNMARKARRLQLASMDKKTLYHLCDKRRIDALVKEVMVERLLSYEIVKGI